MKNRAKILVGIVVVFLIIIFISQTGFMPTATDTIIKTVMNGVLQFLHTNEQSAPFIVTLLRTPIGLASGAITFVFVMIIGFFEFWGYLFSGFTYNFPYTFKLMDIGWKTIVVEWWLDPAIKWHVVICVLLYRGTKYK